VLAHVLGQRDTRDVLDELAHDREPVVRLRPLGPSRYLRSQRSPIERGKLDSARAGLVDPERGRPDRVSEPGYLSDPSRVREQLSEGHIGPADMKEAIRNDVSPLGRFSTLAAVGSGGFLRSLMLVVRLRPAEIQPPRVSLWNRPVSGSAPGSSSTSASLTRERRILRRDRRPQTLALLRPARLGGSTPDRPSLCRGRDRGRRWAVLVEFAMERRSVPREI
jgi:hypothetical protein